MTSSFFHELKRIDEFAFRWNTSKMTDAERVQTMVDASVGKRLTYRPLTDHSPQAPLGTPGGIPSNE